MAAPQVARPTDCPSIAPLVPEEFARHEQGEPAAPDGDATPLHVAVIMDGNRRWARERGLADIDGHVAGVDALRNLVRHVVGSGVRVLSLYAFSRENWGRSDDEVAGLFGLLAAAIRSETTELVAQGVRVRLLGRLAELPADLRAQVQEALDATAGGERLQLNIAFNYGGRTELVDAVRRIVASGIPADEIDEATIAGALYTSGLPDPDLVIRTGGEQRLSNFLIWQSAYAELCSSPTSWPDFGPEAFDAALAEYALRTRRFGR
ncbi:MAG: polyprenyl diphosphate synthase [Chloroflexi bacterium]|nr:polyprenyl diphosphate synthase [Chloroflexota bacterium]